MVHLHQLKILIVVRCKIVATVLGLEIKKDVKPSFPDAQNHWATPYIAAVEKAGIVKGDEKETLIRAG